MNSGSNPSDYEFLLRTLAEGSPLAKAESLRRLNALVQSDKKQFASYAKRVVLALQELLLDPKVLFPSLRRTSTCWRAPSP
jgi:hypothetical protein